MSRVYALRCDSEVCGKRWQQMIRLYIRVGKGWVGVGWFCPSCKAMKGKASG